MPLSRWRRRMREHFSSRTAEDARRRWVEDRQRAGNGTYSVLPVNDHVVIERVCSAGSAIDALREQVLYGTLEFRAGVGGNIFRQAVERINSMTEEQVLHGTPEFRAYRPDGLLTPATDPPLRGALEARETRALADGSHVPCDPSRGTGRTTRQLQDALDGTIYLTLPGAVRYTRNIAQSLLRADIIIESIDFLNSSRARGYGPRPYAMDHAVYENPIFERFADMYFDAVERWEDTQAPPPPRGLIDGIVAATNEIMDDSAHLERHVTLSQETLRDLPNHGDVHHSGGIDNPLQTTFSGMRVVIDPNVPPGQIIMHTRFGHAHVDARHPFVTGMDLGVEDHANDARAPVISGNGAALYIGDDDDDWVPVSEIEPERPATSSRTSRRRGR